MWLIVWLAERLVVLLPVVLRMEVLDADSGRVLVVDEVVVADSLDALVDQAVPVAGTDPGSSQVVRPGSSCVVVELLDVVDMDGHLDIDWDQCFRLPIAAELAVGVVPLEPLVVVHSRPFSV